MTTATIRAAAIAGFECYHLGRPTLWRFAGNATQIRWELVSARVLNGEITTAWDLRREYLTGYDGVKAWNQLSVSQRRRWVDVLAALQRAGAEARDAA